MTQNNKYNFLLYYQCGLAIFAVFAFYTNLDLYLNEVGISPLSSVDVIALFSLACIPLLFSISSRIKYLPFPLFLWCFAYILISVLSFLLFPADEDQYRELRLRFLSVILILTSALTFSKYSFIQLWARRAIFIALIINIFNVFYSLLNPTAFKVDELTASLRPSGFYIDANKGGYALVIGMIFAIGLLKPKYRIYLLLLVGLAILLTFSRGSILAWLVVAIAMIKVRLIPSRQLLFSVVGIGILAFFLSTLLGSISGDLNSLQASDVNYREMLNRLSWFQDPSEMNNDSSSDARFELAMLGWQLFVAHPLFGNGIGSALSLGSIGKSTHNMYLYLMADHGIFGAFIVPLLVYTIIRAYSESKHISMYCAVLILVWCFFSHTVLEDKCTLIMVSLIACMNETSKIEQKSQLLHKL